MKHTEKITVQTSGGTVIGTPGYRFLGIPYGKAERFCPAVEASWEGELDCTEYGPRSPQPNFLGKKPANTTFELMGEEDCLNLNIWTWDLHPEKPLPVVIYIHGGAFQTGGNSIPARAGDRFSENTPMVFVSVNYRLGVLGNLYLEDVLGEKYAHSGDNGELDTLLAMKWVKKNISAFGGDPDNITVLAISAGAKCVGAIMTLPESNELFHKVWLESGGTQALRSKAAGRKIRNRYMSYLPGRKPEDLLAMPLYDLVAAQAKLCDCHGSTAFFGPIMDAGKFTSSWLPAWDSGNTWKGTAVIGNCLHEQVKLAEDASFLENPPEVFRDMFGDPAEELLAMESRGEADYCSILSDAMYRSPGDAFARRLANAGNTVWVYSFDYPPANHGSGFGFLMRQQPDEAAANDLSQKMRRCLHSFLTCTDPDPYKIYQWHPLSSQCREKLVFDKEIRKRSFDQDSLDHMPEYTYTIEQQ